MVVKSGDIKRYIMKKKIILSFLMSYNKDVENS